MQTSSPTTAKNYAIILWLIGFLGVFFVILNQNTVAGTGWITKKYFPVILLISIAFLASSLVLRIVKERKQKFSFVYYGRDIIRTVAAIGIAIYAFIQNS